MARPSGIGHFIAFKSLSIFINQNAVTMCMIEMKRDEEIENKKIPGSFNGYNRKRTAVEILCMDWLLSGRRFAS